jgi:hypothetical protein
METRVVITALLDRLPGLRLDPGQPSSPRGPVFRKPPACTCSGMGPVALQP